MTGDYEMAYNSFSLALRLKKDYPSALRGLMMTEKKLGKYKEALEHCDQLEKITGTSMESIRKEIQKLMKQASASDDTWKNALQRLLEDGRNNGCITSEGFPFIPELMNEADSTCEKIILGIGKYPLENPQPGLKFLVLKRACYTGIGAVYLWNKDWSALSKTGIFETLVQERGITEMDEFVLDCIGYPYTSRKAETLRSYFGELAMKCYTNIRAGGVTLESEIIALGAKAMFAFGMVFEMDRLGIT